MSCLDDVSNIWYFVRNLPDGEFKASDVKDFKTRFEAICTAAVVPTDPHKWLFSNEINVSKDLTPVAEQRFTELKNWLKRKSPSYQRQYRT
jgi:hypothetical protein